MQKTIIVTGASRGIGRGIALVLSRDEGHIVYATARTKSKLTDLAKLIEQTSTKGGKLIPVVCDHSNDDSVQQLIQRVIQDTGRLDVLINNAYGGVKAIADHFGKPFWEKPISVWDASHNVGLRSHYVAAALSVPHMLKNNHGLIINISSSGGKGYLFDIAYGSGKQALDRMGCDMATEFQGTGVKVVTLWPGAVNTETTTFPGAESVEFSGRAIAALMNHPSDLDRYNGKIINTRELAEIYNFQDIDGTLPGHRTRQPGQLRKELETLRPVQWSLTSKLYPKSNPAMKAFFQKQGKL